MRRFSVRHIYQHKDWPKFRWDSAELAAELEAASFAIGKFSGRLAAIGFEMQSDAVCETLSAEILNSAEIEGERLNRDDVRSSVAKRMEIVLAGAQSATSREAESRADMIIDATRNWEAPMTMERLFSWHAALFPTGYSGLSKIAVGRFRDDSEGPMRDALACPCGARAPLVPDSPSVRRRQRTPRARAHRTSACEGRTFGDALLFALCGDTGGEGRLLR